MYNLGSNDVQEGSGEDFEIMTAIKISHADRSRRARKASWLWHLHQTIHLRLQPSWIELNRLVGEGLRFAL